MSRKHRYIHGGVKCAPEEVDSYLVLKSFSEIVSNKIDFFDRSIVSFVRTIVREVKEWEDLPIIYVEIGTSVRIMFI